MSFSAEQHRIMLENSAISRERCAQLKRALTEGRISLADAFKEPFLAKVPIEKLLRCIPYIGPVRANELCARAKLHPHRPVKLVTERQQAVILEFVA